MVQRYSHLAPAHLREAVERLVDPSAETDLGPLPKFAGDRLTVGRGPWSLGPLPGGAQGGKMVGRL